jgi:hypothetical protein
MAIEIAVPIPQTAEEVLWLLIGLLFGRCFGKKLDKTLTYSEWFKNRHRFWQEVIYRVTDFLHHWWVGLLIGIYYQQISGFLGLYSIAVKWFGWGLFLDDIRDFRNLARRYGLIPKEEKYKRNVDG